MSSDLTFKMFQAVIQLKKKPLYLLSKCKKSSDSNIIFAKNFN